MRFESGCGKWELTDGTRRTRRFGQVARSIRTKASRSSKLASNTETRVTSCQIASRRPPLSYVGRFRVRDNAYYESISYIASRPCSPCFLNCRFAFLNVLTTAFDGGIGCLYRQAVPQQSESASVDTADCLSRSRSPLHRSQPPSPSRLVSSAAVELLSCQCHARLKQREERCAR